MMPSGYFDTYHETNHQLVMLRGLIIALSDIILDSPALNNQSCDTSPITSLMTVIDEKARALPDLHSQEWEAVKASLRPEHGA